MSVGITEGYDPSYDMRWKKSRCSMNIVITKRLTDDVIYGLLDLKSNTILHLTCTGLRLLEPYAYSILDQLNQVNNLIKLGFPKEQVVLRIDPIVPMPNSTTARYIIETFCEKSLIYDKDIPLRVRFSFMDMYPHVKKRFNEASITLPYETFNAPSYLIEDIMKLLLGCATKYNIKLETCAEGSYSSLIPTELRVGCVSENDVRALQLKPEDVFEGQNNQRKFCMCCSSKVELIPVKKRCPNQCLYCYWKD